MARFRVSLLITYGGHITSCPKQGSFMLIRTKWRFWTSWRHFGCILWRSQLLCSWRNFYFCLLCCNVLGGWAAQIRWVDSSNCLSVKRKDVDNELLIVTQHTAILNVFSAMFRRQLKRRISDTKRQIKRSVFGLRLLLCKHPLSCYKGKCCKWVWSHSVGRHLYWSSWVFLILN